MADPTTRDLLDRLATLEGTVQRQGQELAQYRRRRYYGRSARRLLPLIMAALLVALVPLATLAANPFTDLTGGPHDGNIDAIFNAQITKGCDPTHYCPTANVTREEMASFLARTAGLGGNPPIANALTAQSAVNATNATTAQTAQSAVSAQNAVSAQTATSAANAQNAAALGGQPPSAFLPASGATTLQYPGATAYGRGSTVIVADEIGGSVLTVPPGVRFIYLPLTRPSASFGRPMGVQGLRVCYSLAALGGTTITNTIVYHDERLGGGDTLFDDTTPRVAAQNQCYDVTLTTPRAVVGQTTLALRLNNASGAQQNFALRSVALTLVPLAAGTAVSGDGGGGNQPQP